MKGTNAGLVGMGNRLERQMGRLGQRLRQAGMETGRQKDRQREGQTQTGCLGERQMGKLSDRARDR